MDAGDLYIENPDAEHMDIEYITYVWGDDGKSIWMSMFDVYDKKCIFVGKPQELIEKYDTN